MIMPQESVLEKELTKTKSTRAKGKEILPKKKHRRSKARARKIPRVTLREKVESPQKSDKQKMEKGSKTWYLPARPGRRIQANVGRTTREKVVRNEKQRRQDWRQSREGSKVTFTDVERLFMILMKTANEEDWKMLANFERDDYSTKLRTCCDLRGRKINIGNSKTLVGWLVSRPTVTRVTFDLPECK